jgi:hypothetical protein
MFKSEIVNRWIVLQQGENHSAIDEEPFFEYPMTIVATSPESERSSLIKQTSEDAGGICSGLSSSKCLPLFSVGFVVQSPLYGLCRVWREVKELQSECY